MKSIGSKSMTKFSYVYVAGSKLLKCNPGEPVRYKIGYTSQEPSQRVAQLNKGRGYGSIRDWTLIKAFRTDSVQKAVALEAMLKLNFYQSSVADIDPTFLNINCHEIYSFHKKFRTRGVMRLIAEMATTIPGTIEYGQEIASARSA
jgi:T5orf172 domain